MHQPDPARPAGLVPGSIPAQGGELPRPFPARVHQLLGTRSPLARIAAALLLLGLASDAAMHLLAPPSALDHRAGAAMAIHLGVAAGMVTGLLAVLEAAVRSIRSPDPTKE